MTDAVPENRENRIRRLFQRTSFEVGLGVFFFGLGIQSTVLHGAQIYYYPSHEHDLHMAMLFDTCLFLVGAAGIIKGIKSLGAVLMLIAGMNPNWPGKS